ncbi:glycerophosphodiester phosphodiesterase [uncultured Marinobacter sp.]|uniref:glycerophosphodiester phosphodiesterase n=1 Tax=uncultured Marinobacter sp. TaxID=187379 RepID=UPI0030D701B9
MIIYGHRGARGEAPENTLPGFIHSYRAGIRHFELDVVLSSDGVPMVIHDLTLDRTTGKPGRVTDKTADELNRMDARTNTAPWSRPAFIPTLEQVLDSCPEVIHFQLEVKTDTRSRLNILGNRMIEMIQRRRIFEQVTVTSSDTWFLQQIKRRNRKTSIGYVAARRFPRPVSTAARLGCDYLIPSGRICSETLVADAHRRDMKVSAWTVNRIHDMLALEAMGVDSIITDYPTNTRIYFDNRSASNFRLPEPMPAEPSSAEGNALPGH